MIFDLFGNTDNPRVVVIGVFHGDEPQGDYLIRKYFKETPETNLLMLPCLNKSGMEAGTRVNSNGVDLNRNFPAKNWILSEKNEFFGGASPASEEETRFVIDLVEKYNPKIILTLHAPFKIVNYDGNEPLSLEVSEKISKVTGYPVEKSVGYSTPGSFGTWAGVEKNISVITLELDEQVPVTDLEKPVFDVFKILEEY